MLNELITLGKDFNIKLAHHSPYVGEEFDANKLFKKIENKEWLNELKGKLRATTFYMSANKPEEGTGLWVSPIKDNGSTYWYDSKVTQVDIEYYEIIPHDDCRILVVDNEDKLKIVDDYKYDYENLSEVVDMIFVNSREYMGFPICEPEHLNNPVMFYGWELISGIFLNNKFTVGEKKKVPK